MWDSIECFLIVQVHYINSISFLNLNLMSNLQNLQQVGESWTSSDKFVLMIRNNALRVQIMWSSLVFDYGFQYTLQTAEVSEMGLYSSQLLIGVLFLCIGVMLLLAHFYSSGNTSSSNDLRKISVNDNATL